MSWTDDRVSLLKRLWVEGKTAAEIAKTLGGVTRNAVIGKAHRLKLSNRVSPIQQNKKPVPKPVIEKKVVKMPPSKPMPVLEKGPRVALTQINNSMCRWPLGDPKDSDFGFCGSEVFTGLPYCADHAKVAYQTATRNRILKAESFSGPFEPVEEESVQQNQSTAKSNQAKK